MNPEHQLPRVLLALFRWSCHPDFQEEIEGDLLEQFILNAEKHGRGRAKWLFAENVLRLLRPEIIVNAHFFTINTLSMKTSTWLKLAVVNLLFAGFVILPYLPGPPNKLSIGFMALGQFTGFFGLVLLPIGFVWAIVEYQKRTDAPAKLNNWNSGYYFAIATTVFAVLIFGLMTLGFTFMEDESWWIICVAGLLLGIALWKIVPGIRNLRRQTSSAFHPAPLYLLSIPMIAMLAKLVLMEPSADRSRNTAILYGKYVVNAIEGYHAKEGRYPDSLAQLLPEHIDKIPQSGVMGIREYIYEKTPDDYKLSFWQHLGATEELVVYNKNNQYGVKGHYASGEAKHDHWRYFLLD